MDPSIGAFITGIGSLVIAGVALYKAMKSTPKELRTSDANVADIYEDIATKSAEKALKLQTRVACLEEDLSKVQDQLRDRDMQIEDLKDWANRLVHQVSSLGGTSVGYIDRRNKPIIPPAPPVPPTKGPKK